MKERRDNRVGIALRWLDVLGVTEGSFETHDLRVVRDLDPAELPAFLGSGEKLEDDLRALLGMVEFAKCGDRPRRELLADHFGLPFEARRRSDATPRTPRGDVSGSPRRSVAGPAPQGSPGVVLSRPRPSRSRPRLPVMRPSSAATGRVDGRHLGQVVKVEGEGVPSG